MEDIPWMLEHLVRRFDGEVQEENMITMEYTHWDVKARAKARSHLGSSHGDGIVPAIAMAPSLTRACCGSLVPLLKFLKLFNR